MNLFYRIGLIDSSWVLLVDLTVWLSIANVLALIWHAKVFQKETS